jgi:hypothetical protein
MLFFRGVELAPFIPRACELKGMDAIVVLTEDVSTVTKWYGMVCIEHQMEGDTLKGFTLIGASHLRGDNYETSVHTLLKRAFAFDMLSTQHSYSLEELAALYVPAASLLGKHPTAWILSE